MNIQSKHSRRRKGPNFRALLDYFMALLMVFFGAVIIFPEQIMGFDYFKDSTLVKGGMKWFFGILFILYGLFRAYRGYISTKSSVEDEDE